MELTKKDKEQLLKWGYREDDIPYIKRALKNMKVESYSVKNGFTQISFESAIKMIGREAVISGVARATFHTSAMRTDSNDRYRISFEHQW